MIRHCLAAAFAMAGLLDAAIAEPAKDDDEGRRLAAGCAICHTAPLKSSGIAPLAGYPQDKLFQAMQDFRSGTKAATVMLPLAKGYGDAQLAAIAAHFAAQPKAEEAAK